ncbi:hypothetical protein [Gaopeijia maritima]|uniref:hypothetical protein n=1 Tax=Gaopeijia maritima TaxID=3119007 RepID=UPI003869F00A
MSTNIKVHRIGEASSGPRTSGDVVFFHGLGGNAGDTWATSSSAGKGDDAQDIVSYFPAVLAADFPEARIWAVDYSAYATKWEENLKYNELERHCSAIL